MAWRDSSDLAAKEAIRLENEWRNNPSRPADDAEGGDYSSLSGYCPAGVCTPDRTNQLTGATGRAEHSDPTKTMIAREMPETHSRFIASRALAEARGTRERTK